MPLIKIIENNIFAIGRYWGNLNSSINGNVIISSMNTGIDVADLNWTWNEKPLVDNDVRIINQIKKNYKELKLPFWWWVYPCGQSRTTKEILQKEGFNYLEAIPCLAVDVSKIPLTMRRNDDIEISFVKDESELKIWEDISFAGFEMPQETKKQYNKFVASFDLSEGSPQKLFLACWMGQPVATALLFLQSDTAGVYFVTTLAAYRNKGIALALILGSMKYAKTSGYKYCVLQSSKEGLDVYLRAGFKEYCRADVYCLAQKIVTTHVVRLKLFRLKAEGTRKTRSLHFGGETADFCIKHGFKVCRIPLHNSVGRVSQTRRVSDCSGNSPYFSLST